eukprot:6187613-Pleurochrysis_carterae.AAC.5
MTQLVVLWVHFEPCVEGIELLQAAAAACISHGVDRAKDVAHMEARLGGEKGRHDTQISKRTLRCLVLRSVVRQHDAREVTEELMRGRNGGHQRHDLKCHNAFSPTRSDIVAEHGSRKGWGRGVTTARSGVLLAWDKQGPSNLGHWYRPCIQERRSHPDSAHKLEQATKFAQGRCVGGERKHPLDAVHRPYRALSRGKKSTPTAATKTAQAKGRGRALGAFFLLAMVSPTVRGTLCHVRRSATIRSVPTAANTMSSVYMSAVCMRATIVRAKVLSASLEPGGVRWVVFAAEILKA